MAAAEPGPGLARSTRVLLWIFIAILVALLGLLAAAPSILSTPAGTRWLLSRVNRRIPGTLAVAKLEMGWLTGLSIIDLQVRGADGELLLAAPSIDTQMNLLAARGPRPHLGESRIVVRELHERLFPDGTTSLGRALGTTRQQRRGGPPIPFRGDVTLLVDKAVVAWSDAATMTARNLSAHVAAHGGGEPIGIWLTLDLAARRIASHVRAQVTGVLEPGSRVVRLTAPSVLEEKPPRGGAGNSIRVAAGSRLAYGGGQSDLSATVDYDLARLTALLAPWLPDELEMEGRGSMELRVRGSVAPGAGLARLRRLTVAPATFTYGRIRLHGLRSRDGRIRLQLHDGVIPFDGTEVPLNGGTLVLAGRIDLNRSVPRYVCAEHCVTARDVVLDRRLAAGPLLFLPLVWGEPAGASGAHVSGTASVRLARAELPLSRAGLREASAVGSLVLEHVVVVSRLYSGLAATLGPLAGVWPEARLARERLELPFALDDGRVEYQGLPMTLGAVEALFGGSVGMDGEVDTQAMVRVRNIGAGVPFRVGGTVSEPRIEGSPDALMEAVRRQAPCRLPKELEQHVPEPLREGLRATGYGKGAEAGSR